MRSQNAEVSKTLAT